MTRHSYRPAEGHQLRHDPFGAIIAPRPIGWISTVDGAGVRNLSPYSFFNAFNYRPPIIGFASIGWKDSVHNIATTGTFGWNLATLDLAEKMNASSADVGPEVDEFEFAGLTELSGESVAVPLVAESPVCFECRLSQLMQLSTASGDELDTWLVLGEVVHVHSDAQLLEIEVYQTSRARPVQRGGANDYFSLAEETRFSMRRPR